MFLLLEDSPSSFTEALKVFCSNKGLQLAVLSSVDIAGASVTFRLNDEEEDILMETGNVRISGKNIEHCLCRIDTFSPSLWPGFTTEDAEYAAAESHALWLSILYSLKTKMVNSPSPDALGGTVLSPTELYAKASEFGLDVPMSIYTESGEAVETLLETGYTLLVDDLGKTNSRAVILNRRSEKKIETSDNCHLVTEMLRGIQHNICLAGGSCFVSTGGQAEKPAPCNKSILPRGLFESIKRLKKSMDLNLCEFIFVKTSQNEWVLQNAQRTPLLTWMAYEDLLLQAVLNTPPEE